MFLRAFLAADIQNFFRRDGAFRKLVAQMHMVVFMNDNVLVHRNQMVHQFAPLGVSMVMTFLPREVFCY